MADFSPTGFLFTLFLASWLGTGAILILAHCYALLAEPNERSSHTVPTPYGGGIAIILILIGAWLYIDQGKTGEPFLIGTVIAATGILALLSFADDLRGLPVSIRLAAQIFAVAFVLNTAPSDINYFGGLLLPVWDYAVAGLIWLWFINLFNFMDGIDGIAGVETLSLSGGIALVVVIGGLSPVLSWLGLILLAAALGFLWWNWQPAKIFLGDVGSVPLGFFLGWLLLILVAEGQWVAAVILPLYYLADATVTLLRRAFRGEKIWRAHKEHFYQRAVQRGFSHSHVSSVVLVTNAALIGCSVWAAQGWTWLPLLSASVVTVLLLLYLSKGPISKFPGDPS